MSKITSVIKRMGEDAVQLLYPLHCPVCDRIVRPWGERICLECLPKLKPITAPWCMQCGKKLYGENEFCRDCGSGKHRYVRGRALYEYESAAVPIYRFKYGGRREYADFFGEQIADHLEDFIGAVHPDGLVPIPLHPSRKAKRGYNQAELLAKKIGAFTGLPVYTKWLVRVKNTVPLKSLTPKERQNNLKKAFNISGNDVKLKKVLLVDDIYTTGATIDEAAQVLKNAGVDRVYFVALASGSARVSR